jgi:DNA-binding transcriptional MocR family regulator
VHPGEAAAIESPTYQGAIDAFANVGARLVPVAVDDAGLDPDLLSEIIARARPRVLYLQPTFHNPTGLVMSVDRRRAVAQMCADAGVVVVEDYTAGDLALRRASETADGGSATAVPSIAHFMGSAPSIIVGSTSKLFWCGLRVGWIRTDEAMVMRLVRAKITADLGTSLLSQIVTLKLMSYYDQMKRVRMTQLTPRAELTAAMLGQLLPEWEWAMPKGGVTFWVRLPGGDGTEFARTAMRHGVFVLPGDAASPAKSHGSWIRLTFAADPPNLERGLRRLAQAWAMYKPQVGDIQTPIPLRV